MAEEDVVKKKIALVTGGNAGIGYETCIGLLKDGFHVVVGARSAEKAAAAVASLLQEPGVPPNSMAESLVLDLARLQSVKDAAATFLASDRSVDVCILNAGIMALPWETTVDGVEQQWQVNALGHFLFLRLLLPALFRAASATKDANVRIIHLSSGAHRIHSYEIDYDLLAQEHKSDQGFDQWRAYGRSKLANILFSNELTRRFQEAGHGVSITSNALHPGSVQTALWSNIGRSNPDGISVQEGALTSIYLATSKEVQGSLGGYYFLCKPVTEVYDKVLHKDLDYIGQSALRSDVSMSETQGRVFWTEASKQVGLDEELNVTL